MATKQGLLFRRTAVDRRSAAGTGPGTSPRALTIPAPRPSPWSAKELIYLRHRGNDECEHMHELFAM